MTPHLARIDLYPIKSLPGLSVPSVTVLPGGALQGDRAFALGDAAGQVVNGKREVKVHGVRSRFTPNLDQITLWTETPPQPPQTFPLASDSAALTAWLSAYFGQPITLHHNPQGGFPDDTNAPGPTVVSTATLRTVADWLGLSLTETRGRFRTNLEVDGVPAFWEDHLFTDTGAAVPFQIGTATFWGINPCQRCIVPTRDTQTGVADKTLPQRFSTQRAATLPPGVARSRFNHFYRLSVNTQVPPDAGTQTLHVGDPIRPLAPHAD